jgi:FtsH-binding integral membrane protein
MWINVNPLTPTQCARNRGGEVQMESDASDLIVGLMMAVFGLIGLFLVAGAADAEMYVFGLALSVFAVLFDFGLIRRHYDRRDSMRAAAQENTHV